MEKYGRNFYALETPGSLASARAIVPELMSMFSPKSVVDVGCGVGAWLSVFRACGCRDIRGFDGRWVERDHLLIDPNDFSPIDIAAGAATDRRYDLALCLEVGEHLPSRDAEKLIDILVQSSDVIIFGAAIPHQGGKGHVNEQWPDYWMEKFEQRGYECFDYIRPRFWDATGIEFWYVQNTFVYIRRSSPMMPARQSSGHERLPTRAVHPRAWNRAFEGPSVSRVMSMLPVALWRAIKYRNKPWPIGE